MSSEYWRYASGSTAHFELASKEMARESIKVFLKISTNSSAYSHGFELYPDTLTESISLTHE